MTAKRVEAAYTYALPRYKRMNFQVSFRLDGWCGFFVFMSLY